MRFDTLTQTKYRAYANDVITLAEFIVVLVDNYLGTAPVGLWEFQSGCGLGLCRSSPVRSVSRR